tara:strand:+ start:2706 stop:3224 length:519 start_codon:yes stop_codon:yes gene_type:complete
MTPEEERVREYLISQGEKYPFDQLWIRSITARLELIKEVSEINQKQADFSFDSNEWTISEILEHVMTSTERVTHLISELANGNTGDSSNIDPPKKISKLSIDELRSGLISGAFNWTSMTDNLPVTPNMDQMSNHSFFGDLHAGAWYLFQRVHDLDHLNQIRNNKSHVDYPDI